MDKWIKQDMKGHGIAIEEKKQVYYYKRKMEVKNGRIKPYYSHIFIYIPDTINELENEWESINEKIAWQIQSKINELIERSNFYLCIFVDDPIKQNTRTQIEGDPYCSKKYIFEKKNMSIDECLEEIEKKIFSLSVNQGDEKKYAIKTMYLQNFRAYDKENYIPLKYTESETASLIVVYAKNGVGKTSLFDAVEYALTGKIGRIDELVSKSKENKMRGPILHHNKHGREDAKVILELDNGEKIERDVKKFRKGGNDYNEGVLIEGRTIINNISEEWNQVILPHDKIDGFIMATKPKERFKEWVSSTSNFNSEREEFLEAHVHIKRIEKSIKESEKEIGKLKKDLNGKGFTKRSAELWYRLVEEFNQKMDFVIQYDKNDSDVEIYETIMNQVNEYLRKISDVHIKEIEERLGYIETILMEGIEKIKIELEKRNEIREEILGAEVRLKRLKEYEALMHSKNENNSNAEKVRELLIPLQKIVDYGEETVLQNQKSYQKNIIKDKEYQELKVHYISEKSHLEEEKRKLELTLDAVRRSLNSNEIDEKLKQLGKEADEEKLKQKVYNENVLKIKQKLERAESDYCQLVSQKDKLESSNMVEVIELLNDENIADYRKIMGEEKGRELLKLVYDFNENQKEIASLKKELEKEERENNELSNLKNRALEYISTHTDSCECPVCHFAYRDWSELFGKVSEKVYRMNKSLKKRIEIATKNTSEYIDKYENAYNQFQDKKYSLLKELLKELLLKTIEIEELKESHNSEVHNLELLEDNRKHRLQQLSQEHINLQEISYEQAEKWIVERKENLTREIQETEKSIKLLDERYEEANKQIDVIKEQIEKLANEKREILQDEKLFSCIEYLIKNDIKFDIKDQISKYNSMLKEYAETTLNLQEQLNKYVDVIGLNDDDIIKHRESLEAELKESRKWERCLKMFPKFTEDSVKELRDVEILKKTRLLEGKEILERIKEEEGAQYFFKEYRQLESKIKSKESQLNKKHKEKDNAEKLYLEKKENLEKALSSYFSQECINEIYQKIDPHETMKTITYKLNFNDKDEPELYLETTEEKGKDGYRPEWFFSTAQLNTVSFSSFFSRAIAKNDLPLRTIFIDDPIGHFDDMNILGFADLMRSMLESTNCQIVMSTHDEKILNILQRKLDSEYYRAKFLYLPEEVKKL